MSASLLLGFSAILSVPQQSPVNVTVYGLRPYSLTGLDNRDTADALGDLFFLLADRVAQRERCAQDPTGIFCTCEVTCVDNVYTQYTIQAYQGVAWPYGACNPLGSNVTDPQYQCVGDDKFHIGSADILSRYDSVGRCCIPPQEDPPFADSCYWKYNTSKHVGGMWYSTPEAGNCDTHPSNCSWRIMETRKIVNESCLNNNIFAMVESHNPACFEGCPQPVNTSGSCYLTCFFAAALQIPREDMQHTWEAAFASDDVAKGGCPGRPIPKSTPEA